MIVGVACFFCAKGGPSWCSWFFVCFEPRAGLCEEPFSSSLADLAVSVDPVPLERQVAVISVLFLVYDFGIRFLESWLHARTDMLEPTMSSASSMTEHLQMRKRFETRHMSKRLQYYCLFVIVGTSSRLPPSSLHKTCFFRSHT